MADVKKLIAGIKYNLKRAGLCESEAEKMYVSAGKKLKTLKENKPDGITWTTYVREQFDLSRERADELIRIADDKTSVKKVRQKTKERMRKHRAAKKPVSRDTGNGKRPAVPSKYPVGDPDSCAFDPEREREDQHTSDREQRSNAFRWQTDEAIRLAKENALIRERDVDDDEITPQRIKRVRDVITAWKHLLQTLEIRSNRGNDHDNKTTNSAAIH